jgi:enoyl-CoA hydratase/carnithine racemase
MQPETGSSGLFRPFNQGGLRLPNRLVMATMTRYFSPGCGAELLPRLVPLNVTKYLLFTGKILSAKEMQNYSLVNEVVPGDQ